VTFTVAATNLFDGDSHPLPIYRETDKIEVTRLPSPVANVQLAAVAPNRVKVTWNSIEGDYTGFRIERSSSTGGDFVVLATLDADVSEFEDGHLQSATSYVYRIIAFNEAGDALGSVSQQVTTPQLTEIRGTEGNETYYVTRSGNLLQVYQNGEPTGPPTYSSAVGDLPQSITIDSLGGYDELVVGTGQESTLGLERLIFKGNGSGKRVTIENGTVRVDSLMEDNTALQTTVEPGAHLISGRLSQDALTISPHARVTLLADSGTSVVHRLNIGAGAVLDIGNNALVIDHWDEPWWPEAVENWIKSGRGGAGVGQGAWNGTGITSSAAALANQTAPESQAIGFADNASLPLGPYSTFRGVPDDDTSILIAYTRTGDANLDGLVNDDDATILGATYAPAATDATWALGDFDYNGRVDDDDATLLGAFYDPSASAQLFSLAGLAVEPTRRSLPARPNESVVELLARYRAESQGQPSDSVWLDWQ
jgi:hypothetical protein